MNERQSFRNQIVAPQRDDVIVAFAACLVTLLVIWTGAAHGWLIRLDASPGPNAPLPESIWGGAGYNSGLPYAIVFVALVRWFGSIGSWIPFAAALLFAFTGMARLSDSRLVGRIGGALVYTLSPVVFERAWVGQIGYLLGYALLPCFFASVSLALDSGRGLRRLRPVLWWSAMVASSVHFLWIGAVVIVGAVLLRRVAVGSLVTMLGCVISVAVTGAYLWPAGTSGVAASAVGSSDLTAFATRGDPTFGLYGNVLGLYGFWRTGIQLPKEEVGGWFIFLALILLISLVGFCRALSHPSRRHFAIVSIGCGFVGYFAALGAQGPTGRLFVWAYQHVPGFGVMREPQKFICLLAFAYALNFSYGVDVLARLGNRKSNAALVGITAVLVPVAYVPTLFFDAGGRIAPVKIPSDWRAADGVMGDGQGKILALPWHQYMAFPFTGGNVVGNLNGALFRRSVISGDNTELPGLHDSVTGRSAYVDDALSFGSHLSNFGSVVRPLGVQYVVLSKSVDWHSYDWLTRQSDLKNVYESNQLVVYENTHASPVGYRAPVVHADSVGQVIGTADQYPDKPLTFVASSTDKGSLSVAPQMPAGAEWQPVPRKTATSLRVPAGPGEVTTDQLFDNSWKLGNQPASVTSSGTVGFSAQSGGLAEQTRWQRLRLSYWISCGSLAVIALGQLEWPMRFGRKRFRPGATD